MANKSHRIINGKPKASGGVLFADVTAEFPETAVAPIPAGYTSGGYVSEDGVTKSESRDVEGIKDWAGLTVKRSQTGFEVTFAFQFLEYLNPDAARTIYGDDAVTVEPATVEHGAQMRVAVTAAEAPHKRWIFDMADGLAHLRVLVPDAQVSETGDTPYTVADGAVRDVTLYAFPDEDGVFVYELSDDGRKVPVVTEQTVAAAAAEATGTASK